VCLIAVQYLATLYSAADVMFWRVTLIKRVHRPSQISRSTFFFFLCGHHHAAAAKTDAESENARKRSEGEGVPYASVASLLSCKEGWKYAEVIKIMSAHADIVTKANARSTAPRHKGRGKTRGGGHTQTKRNGKIIERFV
jgi:hypothetical protein